MATELTDLDVIHTSLDEKLSEKGEKLFKQATIREFLFDGFSIKAYLELLKDPAVALIGDVKIPEPFLNGKFALYEGVRVNSINPIKLFTIRRVLVAHILYE